MSDTTIEEAAAELDAAVREVRRLPWGESPPGTAAVLANYEDKKRALALAVLKEAEALAQYTCHVACDHGSECRRTRRTTLLTRIKVLGQ